MALSLLAGFDDLRRCDNILTDGTAESEYKRFLQIQERGHEQWQATVAETQRIQRELDQCMQERAELETKLFHARRLLENESKARRTAEAERDAYEKKLSQLGDFLRCDRNINDDTRGKLAFLDATARIKRRSTRFAEPSNDINSTGSFLSDLSVTQSEDDFLDISKPFRKHRPSTTGLNGSISEARNKRRSADRCASDHNKRSKLCDESVDAPELGESEQVIATTKVTIPHGDGPIEATSTLQTIPTSTLYARIIKKTSTEKPSHQRCADGPAPAVEVHAVCPAPSAPPLHEINAPPKLLLNLQGRLHELSNRTILRHETCAAAHCANKLKFGSSALKCRTCGIFVHNTEACKSKVTMACVPKSKGTPSSKGGKQGHISEYVPSDGPMVPGIIVRCINEVETRGLSEEGIYRVSGSEKEVKALKERFLRGRGIPVLANTDIHVICGCIKDFLRNLREPLIPTRLWTSFSNAVQHHDDVAAVRDLYASIDRLPQANRDTLAYLILHLQRVATCASVKMPTANLAKIFGPTVVGYSSAEPDQHSIFTETMIQKDVMQHLLDIPTDYWAKFINVESSDTDAATIPDYSYFGTPSNPNNNTMRKERRFFDTPPTKRL